MCIRDSFKEGSLDQPNEYSAGLDKQAKYTNNINTQILMKETRYSAKLHNSPKNSHKENAKRNKVIEIVPDKDEGSNPKPRKSQ